MKTKNLIVGITAVISLSAPLALAQDIDKAAIDKYISAQAKREYGEEYPEARKVITGDLNKDGVAETVVLYTIEGQHGSNNHLQYLAIFKRTNGNLVYVTRATVGGKSYRDVELNSISDGLISVTTMGFAKNDPSCCPTLKGSASYKLVRGKLMAARSRK